MSSRDFSFLLLDFSTVSSIADVENFHSRHGFKLDSDVRDWLKYNLGIYKYWIVDPITGNLIGAVTTDQPDKVVLTECLIEEVFRVPTTKPTRDMTVDSILEKISQVGFDNLDQDEKDFLNEQSQTNKKNP